MAHYAFLDDNNTVTEVIVGIDENEIIEGSTPEEWYAEYKAQRCIRTSYNSRIRGVFASIGFSYNEEEDIFVTPQPYPSWVRQGSYWVAPTPEPEDGTVYQWNEQTLQWEQSPTIS
jgi:hypothetical protein